jgi:CDP-glucose 4,6-dehydratase
VVERARAVEALVSAHFDWRGERAFVTGATGIVGSWLVRRLLGAGAHVIALVRDWDPQSELIRSGDIRRTTVVSGALEEFGTLARALSEHDVTTVFHLGAQTIVGTALRNPLATFEANIRGTYNLLEACRQQAATVRRVVVASSDKAYGDSPVLPYTEDLPLAGRHPYDVSKSCTDLLTLTYAATYGMAATVARCGNIYGGGDLNWSRIVPGTVRSALRGERPVLRSDGSLIRDYVYVEDVVDAYVLLAERTGDAGVCGEAFNFSPESQVSVLEITRATLAAAGRPDLEPVILGEARHEIAHQWLDSSRARERLAWRPRWTLDAGLAETVAWYRNFLEPA